MHAGTEAGGVACRTYLHTLVALLALEQQLTGVGPATGERVKRSAAAIAYLLDRRHGWLPPVIEAVEGTEGCGSGAGRATRVGAAGRVDGSRRATPQADGCETGDWNHVDVYLTKTRRLSSPAVRRVTLRCRRAELDESTRAQPRRHRRR